MAWLRGLTGEPISDEEARALVFVRELGAVDNAAYRSINRTDTLNASTHLRRLRDLSLLAMKGSGNRTYYVAGPVFAMSEPLPAAFNAPALPARGGGAADGTSTTLSRDSHHLDPDGHHPLVTIPEEIRRRLSARGAKPRREVLRRLILDLCALRPLSARELASIFGRTEHKPLVRDYLSPMVAGRLLDYTIPEMENHPEQRYTLPAAAESGEPQNFNGPTK